jgi:3-oxoisoapionate decarboxylase
MTKLGLSSYTVAWRVGVAGYPASSKPIDALGLLNLTNELGLRVLQIADNLPLHTLSDNERHAIRKRADELNIALEIGTRGIQFDSLQTYLTIAEQMGSPILRVVMDTATHHPSVEEIIEILRPQLPIFAEKKITLAIENHDRFKAQTLADLITALDHPNVGICLDTVNSFGALEGPDIVVNILGRFVVNLHVKEFVVKRVQHNMGFIVTGAPTGQGMLNMTWLLETLQAHGREFNAILEMWLSPEEDMNATIAIEENWLHESVRYLRTLLKD